MTLRSSHPPFPFAVASSLSIESKCQVQKERLYASVCGGFLAPDFKHANLIARLVVIHLAHVELHEHQASPRRFFKIAFVGRVGDLRTDKSFALILHRDFEFCLLYTSPSPRDNTTSRMPSSA